MSEFNAPLGGGQIKRRIINVSVTVRVTSVESLGEVTDRVARRVRSKGLDGILGDRSVSEWDARITKIEVIGDE